MLLVLSRCLEGYVHQELEKVPQDTVLQEVVLDITIKSMFTGRMNTMDLSVTRAQVNEFNAPGGRSIQEIFPHLSSEEREFLKTGVTPDEWDDGLPPEGEELEDMCDPDALG